MVDPPTLPPEPTRVLREIADLTAQIGNLREVAEKVVPDVEAEQRRGRLTRIALALVTVLAVGLGAVAVIAVVTSQQQQAQNECYRGYFVGVSRSLADRAAAAAGDRGSNLELLRAQKELLATQNPNRDPDIAAAALGRYVAALNAQEQALLALTDAAARSPIPQPPRC